MSTQQIAEQVESAVRVGDALGKSAKEIHADVGAIVGHLPVDQIDAIGKHIADSVARDNR